MATQLKNIIAFTAVGAGAQQTVAHGLNIDGRGVTPDKLEFDNGEFSFVGADATNVTVQNDGAAPANCNVMAEHWLTVERTFGPVSVTTLTPQPFVVAGAGGGGGGGGAADFLGTTGADVDVGSAAPPVAGQVLKATDATHASWLADSGVSNPLILATGDGTVTAPVAYASGAIGHGIDGGIGTADVQVDPLASGLAIGWVDSYAGGTAQVKAAGHGSFATGYVNLGGAFGGYVTANGAGSHAFGYVYAGTANASIYTGPFSSGGLAMGYVNSWGVNPSVISSLGPGIAGGYCSGGTILSRWGSIAFGGTYNGGTVKTGTFTGGFALGVAYNDATIYATRRGTMARGYATGGANLRAHPHGSCAGGYAADYGQVRAWTAGYGASAQGFATGASSDIYANAKGARAEGYVSAAGYIDAVGDGAFALGYADDGGLSSGGKGTLVAGFAHSGGAVVYSTLRGSIALGGAVYGGKVGSIDRGTIALGYAYGTNALIKADGTGGAAIGSTRYGGFLSSNGDGAMARGYVADVGVNQTQVTAADRGAFASGAAWAKGNMLAFGRGGHCFGAVTGTQSKISTAAGSYGCIAGGYARDGASLIYARERGCFAFGEARYDGDGGAGIIARGDGSVAMGYESCGANSANARIYANGKGAFAFGYAFNNAALGALYSSIWATGSGAMAQGRAHQVGTILASGGGAHAGGYAESAHLSVGTPATIDATALGAFAHGKAQRDTTAGGDATLRASGDGAWAGGFVQNYGATPGLIQAGAAANLAFGYSDGGTILASVLPGNAAFGYAKDQGLLYSRGEASFVSGKAIDAGSQILAQNPGAHAFGYVYGGGYIYANQDGAGAFGVAKNYGYIAATGRGAHAFGAVGAPAATAYIHGFGNGAFAAGYVYGDGSQILARGIGSVAMGYARDGGEVQAIWAGGIVMGTAYGANAELLDNAGGGTVFGWAQSGGVIRTDAAGAMARGYCDDASSYIEATSRGAFASGFANTASRITASQQGAHALGRATGAYNITASGIGSFACGDSASGAIIASAANAVQFGPGTNAVADSLQLGSDFLAKANGQFGGANDALTLGVGVTTFATTSNLMTITGDAGGNTIATITGGISGQELILIFTDANVTITDDNSHAANTVDLSAAFTSADDVVLKLVFDGTSWYEVSRSVN